jgi:antitoxin component HigA of HigAB toxin-antitoxin module
MTIKPIRNDDDLRRVFARLEQIFQAEAEPPMLYKGRDFAETGIAMAV